MATGGWSPGAYQEQVGTATSDHLAITDHGHGDHGEAQRAETFQGEHPDVTLFEHGPDQMEEVLKTVNTDIIVAHTNYLYCAKELLSRVAHTSTGTGRVRVQIYEPLWAATAAGTSGCSWVGTVASELSQSNVIHCSSVSNDTVSTSVEFFEVTLTLASAEGT